MTVPRECCCVIDAASDATACVCQKAHTSRCADPVLEARVDHIMHHLRESPHIQMAQPDVVREKIRTILREGAHQLAVISDFDMTLTTYYQHDGQRSASSHQVFRSWPKIDPVFAATGDALYAKYYPIEVDPTISRHDKQHHMETWWDSIHAALVKSGITRSDLQDMIDHTPVTWREGADTIFSLCHSRGVPLLVISAGLADLIELIMAKAGFDRTNVTIVSNRMIFSDDAREVITGFASPSIHIFNKDTVAALPSSREAVGDRPNILVMGDSVGDIDMAHGFDRGVRLAVGFCNLHVEQSLSEFLRVFDIVVTDDQPFSPFITSLLEAL